MAKLRRPGSGPGGAGDNAPPEPDSLFLRFPVLFEFLTLEAWDDGTPRITGTMLLSWGEGRWRLWLHDRAERKSLWLSGLTPLGLLEGAEAALDGGTGEWRRDQTGPPQAGRRRS